jgi:phosphonate transport system substrate-binding protein
MKQVLSQSRGPWLVALLLAILPLLATAEEGRQSQTYTFGVVPQQSASQLARLWVPLLRSLGQRAGLDIQFRTAPDIPEFERRLAAGEYDFAYMNPYHYTVFSQRPGYRAFAKARGQLLKGILVVAKDSPIHEPRELAGATLAFPAPAAFAASVLTRAYLAQEGISFVPAFVSSHDSVYLGVAKGLYPAGGGVVRTFESLAPEVRDQLRILWTTKGYTPHAFAAHPRVPPDVVERLNAAMLAIGQDDEGRALLEPLSLPGLERAEDSDWNDVRALGIGLLDDLVKPAQ